MSKNKPATIKELRESGYETLSVKAEMRKNLIDGMRQGKDLFPGIIGFEDSVIPHIENAILSGQDIIMLGERGQAKTKIIRNLVSLLDEEIPYISGCEINDNPYQPICKRCRDLVDEQGEDVAISWLPREQRYGEKLATPDITIADLIGEVDPIRVAEGRYLSDELTIHYGLIPRTNRGIFSINELPDLAERIQVGLLNIMEERDVQIRGHRVRLPLDVYVVSSANPEDYTNRGRIITPLKDRYGAQIRTHYPMVADHEMQIMDLEKTTFEYGGFQVMVPEYMREIVAEITTLARRSSDINQLSGVSVRISICNYESLVGSATRRAILSGEERVVPRISDLPFLLPTTIGKIELESVEDGKEGQVVEKLIRGAVLNVFNRYFNPLEFPELLTQFETGLTIETSISMHSNDYTRHIREVEGLAEGIRRLEAGEDPSSIASALEFILEGLHLHRRLNKDKTEDKTLYRAR